MIDLAGARYRGIEQAGHVESWFLEAGDGEGQRGLLLMWTVLSTYGGAALAEAWAVVFDRATGPVVVKESVPLGEARLASEGLDLAIAGALLRPGATRGSLATGARRVAWDVTFDVLAPPFAHLPLPRLYEGGVPPQKVASPYPLVRLHGDLTVNGRAIDLAGYRGVVGHNWGPRHAASWTWAHASAWEGEEELALEALGARPRVGPLFAPELALVSVRYRGLRYELNGARAIARSRSESTARRWRFAARDGAIAVECELWAETDDFVGLHYANPSGPPAYCLNTQLAEGRLQLALTGAPPRTFRTRGAALEIGTTDPHHGVSMLA